jgi:hypothetical protein
MFRHGYNSHQLPSQRPIEPIPMGGQSIANAFSMAHNQQQRSASEAVLDNTRFSNYGIGGTMPRPQEHRLRIPNYLPTRPQEQHMMPGLGFPSFDPRPAAQGGQRDRAQMSPGRNGSPLQSPPRERTQNGMDSGLDEARRGPKRKRAVGERNEEFGYHDL